MNVQVGPVGVILLIAAIRYYTRRKQLIALAPADYPQADPGSFEEWRRREIRSIDVFLWTVGIFLSSCFLGSMFASAGNRREPGPAAIVALILLVGGGFLVLFTGLIVSATYGSRAARLRKKLGIPWPPPS